MLTMLSDTAVGLDSRFAVRAIDLSQHHKRAMPLVKRTSLISRDTKSQVVLARRICVAGKLLAVHDSVREADGRFAMPPGDRWRAVSHHMLRGRGRRRDTNPPCCRGHIARRGRGPSEGARGERRPALRERAPTSPPSVARARRECW